MPHVSNATSSAIPPAPDSRFGIRSLAWALVLLACPSGADAADAAARFETALTRFVVLANGSYGDEGPELVATLGDMARGLAQWDEEISLLEATARAPAADRDARIALARAYIRRSRLTDAARELSDAVRIGPAAAEHYVLLGLVLRASDRARDAATAFHAAWTLDPTSATAAYWFLQSTPDSAATPEGARALGVLVEASRRIMAAGTRATAIPFATLDSIASRDTDAPLAVPAPYSEGYARLRSGDHAGALAQFRRAAEADQLRLHHGPGAAALAAGSAALRNGRTALARQHYADAVGATPDSAEAYRLLGLACWMDLELEQSMTALRTAMRLSPSDERVRLLLARVLIESRQQAQAEQLLRETTATIPGSSFAYLLLGSVLQGMNRHREAADAFEAATRLGTIGGQTVLFDTIGQLRGLDVDAEAATRAFRAGLQDSPNNPRSHVQLALSYQEQDRTDDAFTEYVAALLIDSAEPNALMGLGQLHLSLGRYAEAAAALQRLVALHPARNEARYPLATALSQLGRTDDARRQIADFERGHQQAADARRRKMALDVLREEARARTGEGAFGPASVLWYQVVEEEPDVAANRAALGDVLVEAGRLDAAIEQLERAAALGAPAGIYLQLSRIYARLGRASDSAGARARYERAMVVPGAGATR